MKRVLTKTEYDLLRNDPCMMFDAAKNTFSLVNNLSVMYGDKVSDKHFINEDHSSAENLVGCWIAEK